MVQESVLSHLLVLRARPAVVGERIDADASSWHEDACHLDVLRLHESDEVLHDDVDAVLVEAAVIAEAEEVEFQALALHHSFVGQVADAYLGEVRLSGDGAECRELRAVEAHPIVVLRVFVLESLQHFGVVVLWNLGFLAKGFQALFFSVGHNSLSF